MLVLVCPITSTYFNGMEKIVASGKYNLDRCTS